MGISRMASISESSPSRNKSELPSWILGENSLQKRARTRAESTSSLVLFWPALSVATKRTQQWVSRSPNIGKRLFLWG